MKRGYFRGYFLNLAALAFGAFLFVFPWFAHAEAINSFDVQFAIQKDGTVQVTERIVYDFGTDERHGIYRTIPLTVENGPGIILSDVSVGDGQGNTYSFSASPSGGSETIRIGDPNATVTGQKIYVLKYTVGNVIRGFTDHEEFYWNATGNEWQIPIGHAEASVTLPDPNAANLQAKCYTGPQGSTASSCTAVQEGQAIRFVSTTALDPGEGLTVVVGMPLGSVTNVATGTAAQTNEPAASFPLKMLFVLLPFLAALVIVTRITKIFSSSRGVVRPGKPVIPKELKHDPIVAEYEAPDKLPPIEVGTIMDRRVDPTDISSVIIDLAIRGYLKIRHIKTKVLLFTVRDFELVKLKDGGDLSTPADRELFDQFFSGRDSVSVGTLRKESSLMWKTVKSIQKETVARIEDEGYFDKDERKRIKAAVKKKGLVFLATLAVFLLMNLLSSAIDIARFNYIFFAIFGVLMGLAFSIMRLSSRGGYQLTPKGIDAMRKILGFKEFLKVTETDRLKMLDAPKLEPELFQKNLPYAMVFGVEKEWAKQFDGVFTALPEWYEDDSMGGFSAPVFVSQLALFNTAVNGSFGAYGGSGNYSSGFGGGGFSGGGSGGGGGGSW